MLKKEARKITGGLSAPSKMPGPAHNLPAWRCITGVKLQAVPGSVCAGCYALKNRYIMPIQAAAMERRFKSLTHPQWVEAMTILVSHYSRKVPFFRWHDSGDLQGAAHLKNILIFHQGCELLLLEKLSFLVSCSIYLILLRYQQNYVLMQLRVHQF